MLKLSIAVICGSFGLLILGGCDDMPPRGPSGGPPVQPGTDVIHPSSATPTPTPEAAGQSQQ